MLSIRLCQIGSKRFAGMRGFVSLSRVSQEFLKNSKLSTFSHPSQPRIRHLSTEEESIFLQKLNSAYVANDTAEFSKLLAIYSESLNQKTKSNNSFINSLFTEEWIAKLDNKKSISIVSSLGKLISFDIANTDTKLICAKLLEKTSNKSLRRMTATEITHNLELTRAILNGEEASKYLPISLKNELMNEGFAQKTLIFTATEVTSVIKSLGHLKITWKSLSAIFRERLMKSIVIKSQLFNIELIATVIENLSKAEFDIHDSMYDTTLYRSVTTALQDASIDKHLNEISLILSGFRNMNVRFSDCPEYLQQTLLSFASSQHLREYPNIVSM